MNRLYYRRMRGKKATTEAGDILKKKAKDDAELLPELARSITRAFVLSLPRHSIAIYFFV